jgi:hypothetical protein
LAPKFSTRLAAHLQLVPYIQPSIVWKTKAWCILKWVIQYLSEEVGPSGSLKLRVSECKPWPGLNGHIKI